MVVACWLGSLVGEALCCRFTCWCTISSVLEESLLLRQAVRTHWLGGEAKKNNNTAGEGRGGAQEQGIAQGNVIETESITDTYCTSSSNDVRD